MKTVKNLIVSLKSGSIKNGKIVSRLTSFFLILGVQSANAQNGAPAMSLNDKICYSVFTALTIAFLGVAAYILNFAFKVSRENGKSIELKLPIFKKMAHSEKTVGIFILIVVLLGIIWAVKFS